MELPSVHMAACSSVRSEGGDDTSVVAAYHLPQMVRACHGFRSLDYLRHDVDALLLGKDLRNLHTLFSVFTLLFFVFKVLHTLFSIFTLLFFVFEVLNVCGLRRIAQLLNIANNLRFVLGQLLAKLHQGA